MYKACETKTIPDCVDPRDVEAKARDARQHGVREGNEHGRTARARIRNMGTDSEVKKLMQQ